MWLDELTVPQRSIAVDLGRKATKQTKTKQSVKQCITVDLSPHILTNVVDIQKVHFLLHTPLLNKTPRLSSARTFVRLYRLLLIHCIYEG